VVSYVLLARCYVIDVNQLQTDRFVFFNWISCTKKFSWKEQTSCI